MNTLAQTLPQLLHLGGVAVAIVLVGLLVGRLAPGKRKRMRRTLLPFVLYFLSLAAGLLLGQAGHPWAKHVLFAARLLETLILVNLGAITLFDLLLPRVGIVVSNLITDLIIAAAMVVATVVLAETNLDKLLAGSAVITVVLGVALQATLSNLIGGVALQLSDAIRVGDWVQVGTTQGKIKEIRFRHTFIETRDWDTLIVPNSVLLTQNVTILGRRQDQPIQHRMWVYFNVDFRYSPADVIRVVEDALRGAPIQFVAADPPPNCICFDFARDRRDSFAYYAVRYWLTDLAADDPASSLVRVRLYSALKRANIPLALPAATVFVTQDDDAHAERKALREHAKRLKCLDNVELFNPVIFEEKNELARRLVPAPFAKGEVITREGMEAHWLYILVEGQVEIRIGGVGENQTAITTVDAPSFFGEMGLMTGEKRTATVVARTAVECYRLDKAAFNQILLERPEIAQEMSGILAHRRVGLAAARENLDAEGRRLRLAREHGHILAGIQRFFGLDSRG